MDWTLMAFRATLVGKLALVTEKMPRPRTGCAFVALACPKAAAHDPFVAAVRTAWDTENIALALAPPAEDEDTDCASQ